MSARVWLTLNHEAVPEPNRDLYVNAVLSCGRLRATQVMTAG